MLDLSWLHDEVAEVYTPAVGRPTIDPEAALRLMLAGFLLGIVHDGRLMRDARVNLAPLVCPLWFARPASGSFAVNAHSAAVGC